MWHGPRRRAFTLIEVVLAMSITLGILAVVLFFYQQSEQLRAQLLEETSRISAARLVMDRVAFELATAQRCQLLQTGLRGGKDTLQFARLDSPQPGSLTNPPPSLAFPFRWVTYSLVQNTNADQLSGLVRSEEPLSRKIAEPAVVGDLGAASETNPLRPDLIPNTHLQFLRFRYWNGTDWQDSWSDPSVPAGVEVSLGVEPLPTELTADEYPYELYRRIVYLPNSSPGAGPKEKVLDL